MFRKSVPGILIFFIMFLGASCSTLKTEKRKEATDKKVYVTDKKSITILAPDELARDVDQLQLFTGEWNEKKITMQCYTVCDENGITVFLMNEFGIDMGTLSYKNGRVSVDSSFFPENIKGAYIIADLQNVYYDVSALERNYAHAGLAFKVIQLQDTELRTIYDGNVLIEKIEKYENKIVIHNFLRGYRFVLQGEEL